MVFILDSGLLLLFVLSLVYSASPQLEGVSALKLGTQSPLHFTYPSLSLLASQTLGKWRGAGAVTGGSE